MKRLQGSYFKGFDVTRKLVLESPHDEIPEMLRNLADVLDDFNLSKECYIGSMIVSRYPATTKLTITLIENAEN